MLILKTFINDDIPLCNFKIQKKKIVINPLSVNFNKLSVFDHFVGLALKGLTKGFFSRHFQLFFSQKIELCRKCNLKTTQSN